MYGFLNGKKCIFFGSPDCVYTNQCIDELRKHEMEVTVIYSNARGEDLPSEVLEWKGDFIFSYRNYWLLSEGILNSAKLMAINFHPATPDFPGSGSYSWAIYEHAQVFGITVHLMDCNFDNGKILQVQEFPVDKDETVHTLMNKTSKYSVTVFKEFLELLSTLDLKGIERIKADESPYSWSRPARSLNDLDKMRRLDVGLSSTEVRRRIQAFHFENYPVYFEYEGFVFKYCGDTH